MSDDGVLGKVLWRASDIPFSEYRRRRNAWLASIPQHRLDAIRAPRIK